MLFHQVLIKSVLFSSSSVSYKSLQSWKVLSPETNKEINKKKTKENHFVLQLKKNYLTKSREKFIKRKTEKISFG